MGIGALVVAEAQLGPGLAGLARDRMAIQQRIAPQRPHPQLDGAGPERLVARRLVVDGPHRQHQAIGGGGAVIVAGRLVGERNESGRGVGVKTGSASDGDEQAESQQPP